MMSGTKKEIINKLRDIVDYLIDFTKDNSIIKIDELPEHIQVKTGKLGLQFFPNKSKFLVDYE